MTELGRNSALLTLLPPQVCMWHRVPAQSLTQEFCSRLLNQRWLEIVAGRRIYRAGLLTAPQHIHRWVLGVFSPSVFSISSDSSSQHVAGWHGRRSTKLGARRLFYLHLSHLTSLNLHFLICKIRTMITAHWQSCSKTQKESCTYIKTFHKLQNTTQLWKTVWWHRIKQA